MQRFICPFLAAASLLIVWQAGSLSGRPRYGGTLRVEIQEAVRSLDPSEKPADIRESAAKDKLAPLLFESLVRLDENGNPQPLLALSWQKEADGRRWRFRIRAGVKFHNGSIMTPETAVAALRSSADNWKITAQQGEISIEAETPMPELLYDLAQPAHAIIMRQPDQPVSGTGPFQLAQWESGRSAVLVANEQYWAGRPFLDAVSVMMGRPLAEQLMDLELGKADFIELWPNEMRRAPKDAKIWSSIPNTLIALAFERGRAASENARLRSALALAIDRPSILNYLMQKQGEAAASLLPQKLSGYAFLFPIQADLSKARQLVGEIGKQPPAVFLAYDVRDPLARSMADRIALNARGMGVTLKLSGQMQHADVRLIRLPVSSPWPRKALADLLALLRLNGIELAGVTSLKDLYEAEASALADNYVIPLFHVPEIYGANPDLKPWITSGIGRFGD